MNSAWLPRHFEPFYFGDANRQLFGIYHAPASAPRRSSGLLLCYPSGQEYIRAHRAFRQLGVRASNVGFPVLRFEYYGCGDSMGRREDGSVRQWVSDVSSGVAEIQRRGSTSRVCVVGLRFGATVATLAAAERGDLAGLVLWDPILDGKTYLAELAGEQRRASTGLSGLGSGADALSLPLAPELAASIGSVSLAAVSRRPAPQILVIYSRAAMCDAKVADTLVRLGARVETPHVPGPPIWSDEQTMLVPSPILQSIVAWAVERFP